MVIVYCLLILILLCIVYSFVPYVGIVTILMNDYPKFKVSAIYHCVYLIQYFRPLFLIVTLTGYFWC